MLRFARSVGICGIDGAEVEIDELRVEVQQLKAQLAALKSPEESAHLLGQLVPVNSADETHQGGAQPDLLARGESWRESMTSPFTAAESCATLPCLVITDPGHDLEKELTMVLMRCLVERGVMQPKGIVANLSPSRARARLLRGTLDLLGMQNIMVGVGTEGGSLRYVDSFSASAECYIPSDKSADNAMMSGRRLMHRAFNEAVDGTMTLLLISSMKDAAIFLRDNVDLCRAKLRTVVMMSGVKPFVADEDSGGDGEGGGDDCFLEPDKTAANNAFDTDAASYLYRKLQEIGVPLVVVTRAAAYACKVPRSIYEALATSGSPIGWRLRAAQRSTIEELWVRATSPVGDKARAGLPERCDRAWFVATFCGENPKGLARSATDSIWDLVETLNMYDPMALMAVVPELRERFFAPKTKTVRGVRHEVIGAPGHESHGLKPESGLLAYLLDALSTGISLNNGSRPNVIIVSDPGQDLDDEMAFCLARTLVEEDLLSIEGVVTNLHPARERAALARGTLDVLGLESVPVGVGSDGGSLKHVDTFSESAKAYIANSTFEPHEGQSLILDLYQRAPPTGVHLVLISSMKDAAIFVRAHEDLFCAKTRSVTIMGGVKPFTAQEDLPQGADADGDGKPLEPDTANNNTFDMESAEFLYLRIQQLRVPLIIVSRHTAYKCPIRRGIYDDMAWTGHPIGLRMQQTQRSMIEALWQRAASEDAERRMGLPARCDKRWFCQTFCAGEGSELTATDSIWDLVISFNMYDSMAIIACVPELRAKFFTAKTKRVLGVDHQVIGVSPAEPGIRDEMVDPLRDFMFRAFFKGITINYSWFETSGSEMSRRLAGLSRERNAHTDNNNVDGHEVRLAASFTRILEHFGALGVWSAGLRLVSGLERCTMEPSF